MCLIIGVYNDVKMLCIDSLREQGEWGSSLISVEFVLPDEKVLEICFRKCEYT